MIKTECQNYPRARPGEMELVEAGCFSLRDNTAGYRKKRKQHEQYGREFYRAQRIIDFIEGRFHGASFKK